MIPVNVSGPINKFFSQKKNFVKIFTITETKKIGMEKDNIFFLFFV
jgi:hypothetical protein